MNEFDEKIRKAFKRNPGIVELLRRFLTCQNNKLAESLARRIITLILKA